MNLAAIRVIYRAEMARAFRAAIDSIVAPVISTSLYFVVFGSAIGAHMEAIDGIRYGSYIIPGLVLLPVLGESITNGAWGIYLTKWSGTIYEILSAPLSFVDIMLGYVGAAATKSLILATLILITARLFVPYDVAHPGWMVFLLVLTSITFSSFGFVIGLRADSFQKLQALPVLVVAPLTFLGGAFYSIRVLPPFWQKVTLFNPVVYLIGALRWAFYDTAEVNVAASVGITCLFLCACNVYIWWAFKTGHKLKA